MSTATIEHVDVEVLVSNNLPFDKENFECIKSTITAQIASVLDTTAKVRLVRSHARRIELANSIQILATQKGIDNARLNQRLSRITFTGINITAI